MNAHNLLLASLAWYAVLTLAFVYEMDWGKILYFVGAFILTIGVYIMK